MSEISSLINPSYVKAGEITREVRSLVESKKDWRGSSYLELCNFVEDSMRTRGAEPAFPTNICINESAAHYTAEIDDSKVIGEQTGFLKVDLGAECEGFPADTSITLCYDENLIDLFETTKSVQVEALKVIKADGKTNEVGRVVDAYVKRRGYVTISNLSGHSVDQYIIHSGTSVPNVWYPSNESFKLGGVYAVEHFLTTKAGRGIVVDGSGRNIFALINRRKTKDPKLDGLVDLIWEKRRTLPFALRWFSQEYSPSQLKQMIADLKKMKVVRVYPELVEANGAPVAQVEHTIAITPSGPRILT